MIEEIPDYENLGNSLYRMNNYFNLFNIRIDNILNDKEKWNSMTNTFKSISANLNGISNIVESASARWKSSADLVYNVQGYWEEPIFIQYKNSFNLLANYLEIENWLNENFPPENFAPNQVIRCGFICKNFNPDSLEGTSIINFNQATLEELAGIYSVTVKDIINYINYKNQIDGILTILNGTLRRTNNSQYIITDISTITSTNQFIQFDKNTEMFVSSTLGNLRQNEFKSIHALLTQLLTIKPKWIPLVNKGVLLIPKEVINKFLIKNLITSTAGNFFYKIKDNRWSYHQYTNVEFCATNICGDCYDVLDVNSLYGEKECIERVKYLLTECFD